MFSKEIFFSLLEAGGTWEADTATNPRAWKNLPLKAPGQGKGL